MGFSNFRLNVLLRVLLLAGLTFVFMWSLLRTHWLATPLVSGLLVAGCVFELIRYLERTSRELAGFLDFVAHHDFSVGVPAQQRGRVFDELEDAYRLLGREFRRLNLQKAANHQYLESVVEHVAVALVCLDEHGEVTLMNDRARALFGVPHLNSLKSFARVDPRLPELLPRMGDGERVLIDTRHGDETLQLVLYATTFTLLDRRYQLVSFQNIRDELEQREVDSWQKLIRVLTHEIMNSVTPIISLSKLIRETLVDDGSEFRALTREEQSDLLRSVTAIQTRSSGLLDFVQAYRSLINLPAPALADVPLVPLLERVRTLMSQELDAHGIRMQLDCSDPALTVRADPGQIEQVLINLVANAVDALDGRAEPRIELRCLRDEQDKALVQVIDNGPGIDPAHLDSIFVPFFTTKPKGTGVGLSISRQIMQMNKGQITVRTAPGAGCTFTLKFS